MRIASLLPSATEIACALGLERDLVGVSHECDHPPAVTAALPRLTRSALPRGLTSREIDRTVRERLERGESLYELDEDLLRALSPDLIITQEVCEVCAVSIADVRAVARRLPGAPRVVSNQAMSLEGICADVRAVASAAAAERRGEDLIREIERRLERVRSAVSGRKRPRVAALEWFDPPFAGGHWVPEMIEIAGGRDVLGHAGAKSVRIEWAEVLAAAPEVVLLIPCGYSQAEAAAEFARTEKPSGWGEVPAVRAGRVHALDAAGHFSRPGPRVVEGVEVLAGILHPALA
jgi:iron complex transport system substrate-binding protein